MGFRLLECRGLGSKVPRHRESSNLKLKRGSCSSQDGPRLDSSSLAQGMM